METVAAGKFENVFGNLAVKIDNVSAFGSITISGEDEGLTRCIRDFTVSSRGTLEKTYERILDEKTGRKVARQFYDLKVKHWMTLDELPIPPKA